MADIEGVSDFTSVNTHNPTQEAPTPSVASTSGSSNKRKRTSTPALKFYAVRIGKEPGIYHSWAECLEQVKGFPKATFKSFPSLTDAEKFVSEVGGRPASAGAAAGAGAPTKFYAVHSGRVPGVYTDWQDVLAQITGWKGPKHRAFKTKAEADAFVVEGVNAGHAMPGVDVGDADLETPAKKSSNTSRKSDVKEELGLSPQHAEHFEPGDGPLPHGAEDGFDPTIFLDPATGELRRKTAHELERLKWHTSTPSKDSAVRIYTDGSSLGNGQAGAVAGIGVYFGPGDARNLSQAVPGARQTNQRAELTAVLRALELAPRDRDLVIYSDSNYAINCATLWFQTWRANGWLTSAKKPVENRDLVMQIIARLEERHRLGGASREGVAQARDDAEGGWRGFKSSVKFVWVKGHKDDQGNIAADRLATGAAREARAMGAGGLPTP